MKELFVPFQLSVLLDELGFKNDECLGFYSYEGIYYPNDTKLSVTFKCIAPLYQQAFKWLRERIINRIQFETDYMEGHFLLLPLIYFNRYEIHVTPISTSVYPNQLGEMIPYYEFPSRRKIYSGEAKNYEEAQLYCLFKLIEIVKNK